MYLNESLFDNITGAYFEDNALSISFVNNAFEIPPLSCISLKIKDKSGSLYVIGQVPTLVVLIHCFE